VKLSTRSSGCPAVARLPLLVLVFAHAPLPAQVPPGWWVSAHYRPAAVLGAPAGGLWLHHPTGAVGSIPVTGLSSGLTGEVGGVGFFPVGGACSVVLSHASGTTLYAGEWIPSGVGFSLDLHRIELAGTAAASDTIVGTIPAFGAGVKRISGLATTGLSEDPASEPYVLLALDGLGAGMPQLAVYHPMTGLNVVSFLYGMPAGMVTGVAFTDAYPDLVVSVVAGGATTIVGVPLSYGAASYQTGPIVPIAAVPASVSALDYDARTGLLYCTTADGPAPIYTVGRTTGLVTPVFAAGGPRLGIAYEYVTGNLATVGSPIGLPAGSIQRSTLGGGTALVSVGPFGGWALPAGIDVLPNPRRLSAGPAGPPPLNWDTPWIGAATGFANLPISGNLGWGLSVSSAPGVALTGFLGFSLAPAPAPIPFGTPPMQSIRIELAPPDFLGTVPVSGVGIAPAAIPLPAGLTGLRLVIQGLFAVGLLPDPQLTDAIDVTIL
jgi:hypothetical protein